MIDGNSRVVTIQIPQLEQKAGAAVHWRSTLQKDEVPILSQKIEKRERERERPEPCSFYLSPVTCLILMYEMPPRSPAPMLLMFV